MSSVTMKYCPVFRNITGKTNTIYAVFYDIIHGLCKKVQSQIIQPCVTAY